MALDLSWDSFRTSFIEPGVPGLYPVGGQPPAHLFVDAGGARIGLWLPVVAPPPDFPRSGRTLSIRLIQPSTGRVLEVATSVRSHFEQFYKLAKDIIVRMDAGASPGIAARDAILAWRELLRESAKLSQEEELGLWGELWFLEWLIQRGHVTAVDAWTGPLGDPHDFRFGHTEVEVKTSTQAKRQHTISSLEQLIPSVHHGLAVTSILVAPTDAATGLALSDLASRVRTSLSDAARRRFDELLELRGFDPDEAELFGRHFTLRSDPNWIPVDGAFPVLGRNQLLRGLGEPMASLILRATYVVDLDGLGTPLGLSALASGTSDSWPLGTKDDV